LYFRPNSRDAIAAFFEFGRIFCFSYDEGLQFLDFISHQEKILLKIFFRNGFQFLDGVFVGHMGSLNPLPKSQAARPASGLMAPLIPFFKCDISSYYSIPYLP
jgi:hypothetical protein